MKRFWFMCFITIILVSMILPACAAPKGDVIKVGVIGPMKFMEGEHHWMGATMARDEINAAGGVNLNGKKYQIELIKADSNEILNPTEAASAMERLITVDKPDFIVGGFRTEGVFPMQEVAMDYKKIFLNCGAATLALQQKVQTDYNRYKYFFKITPYNEVFLVSSNFKMIAMVAAILKKEVGIPDTEKLRVAIIAEKLAWTEGMVKYAQAYLPKVGMEVTGVWQPSDTATDVNAELTAIAATNPHIIFPIFSGPVGVTFGKQAGELQIPAAIVGIVVEAQKKGYWEATGGKGNYITTLNTYAKGVEQTPTTVAFFNEFEKRADQYPAYTAATYDAIKIMKEQIEKAQSLDPEVLVPLIENIDYIGTAGRIKYYPVSPDTKAPACPHDIQYGPGLTTGIATQWQNGALKGVWPAKGIGTGGFETIDYPGIVPYILPPAVIEKFKAK